MEKFGQKSNTSQRGPLAKLDYNDRLMVMHRNSVNFIKISSINVITASRDYSYIHTLEGREYLTATLIGQWESRLPESNFCRIHRSSIINFEHIVKITRQITGTGLVFIQGIDHSFEISRNYFRRMKERYSV
ncbi:MAG: LytTR family DNA-binding domain-containing protein [Bacteroidales bacterium]